MVRDWRLSYSLAIIIFHNHSFIHHTNPSLLAVAGLDIAAAAVAVGAAASATGGAVWGRRRGCH